MPLNLDWRGKALGPVCPWYIDDFAGGTAHYSVNQIGAYYLLLVHQWANGFIPTDLTRCQAIARCDLDTIESILSPAQPEQPKFILHICGGLINVRMAVIRNEKIAWILRQRAKQVMAVDARRKLGQIAPTGDSAGHSAGHSTGYSVGNAAGHPARHPIPLPLASPLASPIKAKAIEGHLGPAPAGSRRLPESPERLNADYGAITAKSLPPITDYADLHAIADPIKLAMTVAREPGSKNSWKSWVKTLSKARKELGPDRADRIFRDCCEQVYSRHKAGEISNCGAMLNKLLGESLG